MMSKIKELANKRIDLLHPHLLLLYIVVIIEIAIGLLLVMAYKGLSIEQFLELIDILLELIDILVWPIVVFLAFLFFRKISTYLFLSLSGFNFFGIKGEFKSPREVIEEKVKEEIERIREQEKINEKISDHEKNAYNLQEDKKGLIKNYKELLVDYKELNKKYRKLQKEERQEEAFRKIVRERVEAERTKKAAGKILKEVFKSYP